MDDMKEIMEDFLIEAFELIEQIDHDLVELEANPEDLELLNRIFRVAHTVKGSSSFLNFDVLTELTHHMEDVLNKARKGELKITPDIMDVVLESVDMMKGLLESIRDNGSDAAAGIDIKNICVRLTQISEGEAPSAAAEAPAAAPAPEPVKEPEPVAPAEEAAPEVSDAELSKLSDSEVEAEIERLLKVRKAEDQARRASKGIAPKSPEEIAPATSAAPAPAPKPAPSRERDADKKVPAASSSSAVAQEQTIRVEVKRLDHLMNLIGELVLGKNRLLKIYDDVEERYEGEKFLEELNQVVSSLSLVTTDIQLAVMKTRMLPIAKVFNKFPRMIRDLSRELGKQIDLEISGEETELDKSNLKKALFS